MLKKVGNCDKCFLRIRRCIESSKEHLFDTERLYLILILLIYFLIVNKYYHDT